MKKILVTGATGQIGSELVPALRKRYGKENVIAAGHSRLPAKALLEAGPYCKLDVRDSGAVRKIAEKHKINTIYHLASILSAPAEKNPSLAWDVNMNGLSNILEAARIFRCSFFFPSSIGAFGSSTPSEDTPQEAIQRPETMYGITKVSGELLCDYYHRRFGVDTRGLRFPGLISYLTPPGGGTTDYAVDIFYSAVRGETYNCFLREGSRLDMMYMPDAIAAAINIMEADPKTLRHRNAFNVTAMCLSPAELYREIKNIIPSFEISYELDPVRQAIADSWPHHMDDSAARKEWGWQPEYGLEKMVRDMIEKLSRRLNI